MIDRDPKCVFVADSLGLAEATAAWLTGQGFEAQVMNPATLGGLDGLTWLSRHGVAAGGIEVWVLDPARAPEARALLEQHATEQAARAAERSAGPDITVTCEECGGENVILGREAGKVVSCRHCGDYLDVPDGSAPPEWEDVGEEEADEA